MAETKQTSSLRNRGGKGSNILVEEHQVTTTTESTMNALIWDNNKSFRTGTASFRCLDNGTPVPYQHFVCSVQIFTVTRGLQREAISDGPPQGHPQGMMEV